MMSHAKTALGLAKENGMYVLLDADALWMLGQDLGILKGYRRAVITPNVVEFNRLSEAVVRRLCVILLGLAVYDFNLTFA